MMEKEILTTTQYQWRQWLLLFKLEFTMRNTKTWPHQRKKRLVLWVCVCIQLQIIGWRTQMCLPKILQAHNGVGLIYLSNWNWSNYISNYNCLKWSVIMSYDSNGTTITVNYSLTCYGELPLVFIPGTEYRVTRVMCFLLQQGPQSR